MMRWILKPSMMRWIPKPSMMRWIPKPINGPPIPMRMGKSRVFMSDAYGSCQTLVFGTPITGYRDNMVSSMFNPLDNVEQLIFSQARFARIVKIIPYWNYFFIMYTG